MSEEKALTVKELIEKLKEVDSDLPVSLEGCDCYGLAKEVEIAEGTCFIKRFV